MNTLARITVWGLAGISAIAFALAALIYGPSFIQPLYLPKLRYEIPDGYRGWVLFEMGNPHCLPLPHQGRFLIYVVDARGRGCTSDPAAVGWRTVKYDYVRIDGNRQNLPSTGWGKGGLIWDEGYRVSGTQKMNVFFVGTEQEFHVAATGPIE
jgi:hypothetical protein